MTDHWLYLARDYIEFQRNLGFDEILLSRPVRIEKKPQGLEAVRADMGDCTRCPLHRNRTNIVFGEGDPNARLMFVGEGPGAEEDRQARPFVGKAGQLLTRMIEAMGTDRSRVYIANIVKCRPPGNRDPETIEIQTCLPFLQAQIKAIGPAVLVALGRIAANTLLDTKAPLASLRGEFRDFEGIPLMPTYHPSFLLRQEQDRRYKADAWSDLKQVMGTLGLSVPAAGERS